MRMKMLTFGFGVITGAALTIAIPCIKDMTKAMMDRADREIHATKKVLLSKSRRLKDDVIDAASEITSDIRDLADTILVEIGEIDIKGLSPAAKKAFNKMKTHVITLKNELLKQHHSS